MIANVFPLQHVSAPRLDVIVQIRVSSKWQDMNSRYHSANLVPAQQGGPELVRKYFMRLFVPSEYLTNVVVVIPFVPPSTAVGEPDSSICLQVTN
jgi:hypothetical protein